MKRTILTGLLGLGIVLAVLKIAGLSPSGPPAGLPYCSTCTPYPARENPPASQPALGSLSRQLYIDRDGDGYGVASPLGPDADDHDASVNTSETVLQKHGSLEAFLEHLGYVPGRIYYVDPPPDGVKGEGKGDFNWDRTRRGLRAGDVVVFRAGRYTGNEVVHCNRLRGTSARPIVIMAYPGQRVILDGRVASIAVKYSSSLIFDGFVLDHSSGSSQAGIYSHNNRNVTYRNLEITRHYRGWFGMQDLHNVTMEGCVVHENLGSHGIYLGARDKPCSGVAIRGCAVYQSGRHGIQFNGRVRNFLVEDNTIHSNSYGGISLTNGVCDSVVRGNLIFNNNRQGIIFHHYDDTPISGILPYDQTNNLVENNTIWVGRTGWRGDSSEPSAHAAIDLNDSTAAQIATLAGTVIRNNVFVTYRGPTFRMSDPRFLAGTTIESNLVYRTSGQGETLKVAEKTYPFEAMEDLNKLIRGNIHKDPGFADVSIEYYARPEAFDFSRR